MSLLLAISIAALGIFVGATGREIAHITRLQQRSAKCAWCDRPRTDRRKPLCAECAQEKMIGAEDGWPELDG